MVCIDRIELNACEDSPHHIILSMKNEFLYVPPTLSTIDKLLVVADSLNTLSCDCDRASRLKSLNNAELIEGKKT